jgi:hypothetical protein
VSGPVDEGVVRARTELAAARLLADNDFGAQAVSRAYYVQEAASHADPRTTMRYDRGRQSLDRHATYIVATFIAGASR